MIRVTNLTKFYGKRLAVDDISFEVGKGEIVGFLGPNAAGKSTTMRLLTGYLLPSRGEIEVAGCDMIGNSLEGRRQIGYLPEIAPLYLDMTMRAYLLYVARLRGLERRKAKSRLDEVVAACMLEEYLESSLGKLSKGFRQRVGLAQAIIHDPPVLILDEPTVGIDPIQVAQTRRLIRELGKDRTILLSTHILPEVSTICERVVIINAGRIVAQDRIEHLSSVLNGVRRLRINVQGPPERVSERLKQTDGVQAVSYEKPFHIVAYPADQQPQAKIMEAMARDGWTLLAMESIELSLEDIFLQLTAGERGGK